MPIACPKGTEEAYRYKTTKTEKKIRLGGCMKKGKFVEVKEVKVDGRIKRIQSKTPP